MKRVTAFLIAFILFSGTVLGIHTLIDKKAHFDPHSFGSWISSYKFFATEEIKENMNENTILTLGSSEFRHGKKMSSHPANLFKDNALNMMMVGAGYYQSLFHAVELSALSDGVKNKKVVLILSPQWFTKEGVLAPAYASRFSDETFVAMLQNKKLSQKTKDYMIQRSKALLSGDPQTKERVERYERVFLNKNPSFYDRQYVRFYRGFLAEKSKVGIAAAAAVKGVEPYNPKKRVQSKEPDWAAYNAIARKEGQKGSKDNPFYVANRVYRKNILPKLDKTKNSSRNASYAESPEYDDLRCFLNVCRETGIQPMLVLMPVNGYWYDHIGFPKTERNAYYKNIRKLAAEYGADLADFAKDEYTRYFFLDKVHLGWKGWLDINESIYRFATEAQTK